MTDLKEDVYVDIKEIIKNIPHRYPFLLIDRVKNLVKNKSATGVKNVTINEQFFAGHFPVHPVMPGVLIIESMAQTAGILISKSSVSNPEDKLVFFTSIEDVKFKKTVVPGDQLILDVKLERTKLDFWKFNGVATVDGQVAAKATFAAKVIDKKMSNIHKTAIIEKGAKIGDNVFIGPYCVVGKHVVLGDNVQLKSHVVIENRTSIGKGTIIYPFASIGHAPQDLKYSGEESELVIGENNVIREYVTMNPGTSGDKMKTVVGNNCLFMASSHVAHDCIIGNHVILANNATLGGHVQIEDFAILGGLSAVHQFTKIGAHSMIGGMSGVRHDVPPYTMVIDEEPYVAGINIVGLKRRGFSREDIKDIKQVYDILFSNTQNMVDAIKKIEDAFQDRNSISHILRFLKLESTRGISKPKNYHEQLRS